MRFLTRNQGRGLDYVIDDSSLGRYALFFKDITMEQSEAYIEELKNAGYKNVTWTKEDVAIGVMLQKDDVTLSVACSDEGLGIQIILSASVSVVGGVDAPQNVTTTMVIDTASFDIDDDGVIEECAMYFGPTSGLFTVVISASVDGTIKYKNTFNLSHGELSFTEKDGAIQFVRDGEFHRLFVEDNRIVIENLDPQYEGYWGDAEWNYDMK